MDPTSYGTCSRCGDTDELLGAHERCTACSPSAAEELVLGVPPHIFAVAASLRALLAAQAQAHERELAAHRAAWRKQVARSVGWWMILGLAAIGVATLVGGRGT